MKREYWIVLIVYIAMQFSSIIGVPLAAGFLKIMGIKQSLAYPVWLVAKFVIALAIVLFVLRKESLRFNKSKPFKLSFTWALLGVFLALLSQYAAGFIESLLGFNLASKNTQHITQIINSFPLAIIVSSIMGPALEEIVFRKILFGYFHKRFNFLIAAAASSFVFALAHLEPEHILRYAAIGFTFAFLYVKRNNIIAPIFAHVMMNTIVVLIQ
jgi:membrane protease YdiL (CAAX protease family)